MVADKIFDEAKDFLPILGIDYIEFYVGNAKQSAYFYKSALGFESEAYSGLETGDNSKVSYVIKQEKIRFVLTSSYIKNSEINEHYLSHGDGVKVVAFLVEDSKKTKSLKFYKIWNGALLPFLEYIKVGGMCELYRSKGF